MTYNKDLSAYSPPARNLSLDQVLGILDEEIHASEILSSTDKNQKQREARATKIKTMRFVSDLLQARAEAYAAKGAQVVEADKSIPVPSADLLKKEDGTVRLWARVGMSLDVSPETYTRLKGVDLFAAIHPQREVDRQPTKSPLDAQIKDAQSRTGKDTPNNEKEPER